MTEHQTDELVRALARAGVGPRMTARVLGLSVAWVAVVRKRLDIRHADPTPDQVLAELDPALRSRCIAYRDRHARQMEQSYHNVEQA